MAENDDSAPSPAVEIIRQMIAIHKKMSKTLDELRRLDEPVQRSGSVKTSDAIRGNLHGESDDRGKTAERERAIKETTTGKVDENDSRRMKRLAVAVEQTAGPIAFKRVCSTDQILGPRLLNGYRCKATTHTGKYCLAKRPAAYDSSLFEMNNRRAYVKIVRLNEHPTPIKGLVDASSSVSIIKKSTAERYGMKIVPCKVSLNIYGNVPCGETEARVRIDGFDKQMKLLVMIDDLLNYDIIVGRAFIKKAN